MVCGIGFRNEPVNGDNTIAQSLDSTLIAFGVADPDVRMRTYRTIKSASEAIFTAYLNHEKTMSADERG